jgi:cell division protein FtsB
MGFALLITWGVINGGHGLRIWQQKRAEDRQLQRQIEDLKQENARLQEHVERLKSDPNTIEQAARERLHYARPGEVIYALPPETQNLAPPAGAGK